jgi:hypothetical protein
MLYMLHIRDMPHVVHVMYERHHDMTHVMHVTYKRLSDMPHVIYVACKGHDPCYDSWASDVHCDLSMRI